MIGWALRWVGLCCVIALFGVGMLDRGVGLLANRTAQSGSDAPVAPVRRSADRAANTIVYTADRRGHVIVDAAVNGAPVKMLVDTGASLVTLTPEDARAAGIMPNELVFGARANTANGIARMAPVTLRELRIGQLSIYGVRAAVIENLNVSLLGMSFLGRLQSYEMRDGKLSITW